MCTGQRSICSVLGLVAIVFVGVYFRLDGWLHNENYGMERKVYLISTLLADSQSARADEKAFLESKLARITNLLQDSESEKAINKVRYDAEIKALKAGSRAPGPAATHAASSGKVPVWVWWDFPHGVPTAYRLNLRTWLRHLPADRFELKLVNSSNVKEHLPDLPSAFFRLYQLARSDFIRAAMLAVHGGVYMDGDMLLREDLGAVYRDIFEEDTVDVVPYLFDQQVCRKSFSTNFIAGKKGNGFSTMWHERLLKRLRSRCPKGLREEDDGMYEFYADRGCCKLPGGEPRKTCHVTFGSFGDKAAHWVMQHLDSGHSKTDKVRMMCIPASKGFAANVQASNGELMWKRFLPGPPQEYVPGSPVPNWHTVPLHDKRTEACWREGGADLRCSQSGLYVGFFERHGYHLFNMINGDLISAFQTEEELLASQSVVAELYRVALAGESRPDPRLEALGLVHYPVPEHSRVWRHKWDGRQVKMPWLPEGR